MTTSLPTFNRLLTPQGIFASSLSSRPLYSALPTTGAWINANVTGDGNADAISISSDGLVKIKTDTSLSDAQAAAQGKLKTYSASSLGGSASSLVNNNGTFTIGGGTWVLADINGDGRQELIFTASDGLSGKATFFNADGSLMVSTSGVMKDGQLSFGETVRGRYDADAIDDIFYRDTTNVLWVSKGLGGGSFAPMIKLAPVVGGADSGTYQWWNSLYGDVTGDGRADAIAIGQDGYIKVKTELGISADVQNSVLKAVGYLPGFAPVGAATGGNLVGSEGFGAYGFGQRMWRNSTTDGTPAKVTFNVAANQAGDSWLTMDLAILDSWDGAFRGFDGVSGDTINIKIDGVSVAVENFTNPGDNGRFSTDLQSRQTFVSIVGANQNLAANGIWVDSAYRLNVRLANLSAGSHTIEVFANGPGWEGGENESFAIDNIKVQRAADNLMIYSQNFETTGNPTGTWSLQDVNNDGRQDIVFTETGTGRQIQAGFNNDGSLGTIYKNDLGSSVPKTNNFTPTFTGANSAQFAENGLGVVITAAATDNDPGTVLTYSIAGGEDAGKFKINAATGAISFVTAPNYEAPTDTQAGGSNSYYVIVKASDGTRFAQKVFSVFVTDVADGGTPPVSTAPVFTSPGPSIVNFAENRTGVVLTASATDSDPGTVLTYSITGGEDASKFNINSATGAISFKTAPDFETPTDGPTGGSNSYNLVVTASDGALSANKAVTVLVTDVNENQYAPTITSAATATYRENSPSGTFAYQIRGQDQDAGATPKLVYSLAGGEDAESFTVDATSGVVNFKNALPDFDFPRDVGKDNTYKFTVKASDGLYSATRDVVLTITNDPNDDAKSNPIPITSSNAVVWKENRFDWYQTSVSSDWTSGYNLTYYLTGVDADRFQIDNNGAMRFKSLPDYEKPTDAGGDNIYNVVVNVTNSGFNTGSKALTITVQDVAENNNAPVFTSGSAVGVVEKTTGVVYQAQANDADGDAVTYSLAAGKDANKFSIVNGKVSFVAPPVFNASGSNAYSFDVLATDGLFTTTKTVSVSVSRAPTTGVDENMIVGNVGDVTGDGKTDAIAFNKASGTLTLTSDITRANSVAGAQQTVAGYVQTVTGTGNASFDINGDGKKDFLFRNADATSGFAVLFNKAGDIAATLQGRKYGMNVVLGRRLVGDFNGDGIKDADILDNAGTAWRALGTGNGSYGDLVKLSTSANTGLGAASDKRVGAADLILLTAQGAIATVPPGQNVNNILAAISAAP